MNLLADGRLASAMNEPVLTERWSSRGGVLVVLVVVKFLALGL